jgi:hypothetical protein
MPREECPECGGSGDCPSCSGIVGAVRGMAGVVSHIMGVDPDECDDCGGSNKCRYCEGRGWVPA